MTRATVEQVSHAQLVVGMKRPTQEHDLMFGLVAVSRELLAAELLVETVTQLTLESESPSLPDVLVRRGALTELQRTEVEEILDQESSNDISTLGPETLNTEVVEEVRARINMISDSSVRESLVDFMTFIDPNHPAEPVALPPRIANEGNRFQVRKELARGGLGQVFVAHDKQLNRNVALKQILERWQDHPTSNERFLTEAEITGRLEHPGVVPVYALGSRGDGRYYYAMRLIRGVTLEDEIDSFFAKSEERRSSERNLELRKLLRRFIDVCNTIDYAHSRGVIHRDLKPPNIMLGKYGETLVVDWGLAKQVDVEEHLPAVRPTAAESILVPGSGSGSGTRVGSALGTPQYMSPEQAAGQLDIVGPASDIYGLGATLYHLLTGQPPQTDSSLHDTLEKVKNNEFPTPRTVRSDVAKPLEAICLKAMRLAPERRYATAGEMAQDIERWFADQRVPAYHEPFFSRGARWIRRHQAITASATVAVLLMCLAAVAGSIAWQRAKARESEQAFALQQQVLEREKEEQKRLSERRSTAEANLQFGLAEARAGRFQSALTFFRQGEAVCTDEPEFDEVRERLAAPIDDLSRLVAYRKLTDDAIMALTLQEDQRAMELIAGGLRELGVFDNADWWNHLPVDYTGREAADAVEKQVYVDLVTVTGLLAKSAVSQERLKRMSSGGIASTLWSILGRRPSPRQLEIRAAMEQTAVLAQTYQESQWLERLVAVGGRLFGDDVEIPDVDWQLDNFADTFYLGAICAFASLSEDFFFNGLLRQFLGIDDMGDRNLRESSLRFLRRTTELDPNHYLSHVMLGWMQYRVGEYDAAIGTLSHGIALRPDMILAYDWRSLTYVQQAEEATDEAQRQRLLQFGLRDANSVCEIQPGFEIGFWLRGNALRALGEHSQAVTAYLHALDREPPIDMISMDQFILMLQQREAHEMRRLGDLLPDRFKHTRQYAQELQKTDPYEPRYTVLDATAAFALQQWDDAEQLASRSLELLTVGKNSDDDLTQARLISRAHAIAGEVHRSRQQWELAHDALTQALKLDPNNSLAAEGLALVLLHYAQQSNTTVANEQAMEAMERLAKVGVTDWHLIRSHRGRFALLLGQQDLPAAAAALEAALAVDSGQDVSELVQLAKAHSADEILTLLAERDIVRQLATVAEQDRFPKTLPVRNSDFELGLDSYWLPWATTGDCFAEASMDRFTRPGGKGDWSLRIDHHSARKADAHCDLQQSLQAVADTNYRLSLWCKGEGVAAKGLKIVVNDAMQTPVIALPPGTYDWQQFSGEFKTDGTLNLLHPSSIKLRIVSSAPGTVWLDDLTIERVE